MATRRIQFLLFLAEASNPISLPKVPLPNASSVRFTHIQNSVQPNVQNF